MPVKPEIVGFTGIFIFPIDKVGKINISYMEKLWQTQKAGGTNRLNTTAEQGKSIEITAEQMESLEKGCVQVIDIRSEIEISYGRIPDSSAVSAEELLRVPPRDKSKCYIICCSRGQYSKEVAEKLRKEGYDAVSLQGGYIAWLMAKLFQELKRYSGFPLRWNMWSWIPATAKQTAV